MRRSDFLKLTGLKPDFFNALLRKGALPRVDKSAHERGWGDYSPESIYLTRLALDLARLPVTQFQASRFVGTEAEALLSREGGLEGLASGDVYFGFAFMTPKAQIEDDDLSTYTRPLCGSLDEIFRELRDADEDAAQAADVVLTNASLRYRQLKAEAARFGIADKFVAEIGEAR